MGCRVRRYRAPQRCRYLAPPTGTSATRGGVCARIFWGTRSGTPARRGAHTEPSICLGSARECCCLHAGECTARRLTATTAGAERWRATRRAQPDTSSAAPMARASREAIGGGLILDLGCGPGAALRALGDPIVGVGASLGMLAPVEGSPGVAPLVAGDIEAPRPKGSFQSLRWGHGEAAVVENITDGDTIRVSTLSDEKVPVRLIGVDASEMRHAGKDVQCFAEEASGQTRLLLPVGTQVHLVYEVERTDRYGRTLAYVYRHMDELFVNLALAQTATLGNSPWPRSAAPAPEVDRV